MKTKLNERGVVSLLAVVMVSFLLLVITIGLITLMNGELRQASDASQSILGYIAAESGIEQAIPQLHVNPNLISTNCSFPGLQNDLTVNGGGSTVTTGQKLNVTCVNVGSKTEGTLKGGQVITLDTDTTGGGGGPFPDSIKVEWDSAGQGNLSSGLLPGAGFSQNAANWDAPAVLEMTDIGYKSGRINPSDNGSNPLGDTVLSNFVLRPTTNPTNPASTPILAHCTAAAVYHCQVQFSLAGSGSNHNHLLRLRIRYPNTLAATTNYRLTFYHGGVVVPVADQYATIDATARAGDTYRRVVAKVPIQPGLPANIDYVLFGDTGVCKDSSVGGNSVTSNCP
jgi:hypothetical protein